MRSLILNSSQPKHPVGADPWVRKTLLAVDDRVRKGHEIVTSLGLPSWELALWRCAEKKAVVHLICPIREETSRKWVVEHICDSFGLRRDRVRWYWIEASGRSRKIGWAERDALAFSLADEVLEVSVRPSGKLAKLLKGYSGEHGRTFAVPFDRSAKSPGWERRLPPVIRDLWPRGSLVHLTRSSDGPWPGESSFRYYRDLVSSGLQDPRSAFFTLARILEEGRVRGSEFRARGNVPRVCLTACSPKESLEMVRFRARYARYGFEPYGLVFLPGAVSRLGAKPVVYGEGHARDFWAQGQGAGGHWRREREWRVLGDVELSQLDSRDVLVLTAMDWEARKLGQSCPYEVRSFGFAERNEKIDQEGAARGACLAS